MGITDTPFTVVVSLPEYEHTGSYRVRDIEEIHRSHAKGTHFKFLINYPTATKASNDKILSYNLEFDRSFSNNFLANIIIIMLLNS